MRTKVCIAHHCPWKQSCDLYFKTTDDMHRAYIKPDHVAEHCPYYVKRKFYEWGVGKDIE